MRYVIKFMLYFGALFIFMYVGMLQEATTSSLLIAAAVLALVNTLIRPILSVLTFPLSIVTLGIAQVFVNILMIVISNGIVGGTLASGFWVKALIAVVIMLLDNGVRYSRHLSKKETCVLRH